MKVSTREVDEAITNALMGLAGTPGNGLGIIQIQLDFGTWTLLDLDLVAYGHSFALGVIGLDYVG